MTDINAAAIVSYVKHWDNDTKGTMEFPNTNLDSALIQAKVQLRIDAFEEGISNIDEGLFTITKVTYGVPSNWLGV